MALIQSNGYFDNPYFSEDELKCKGSGELKLAPGFLGELIHLRRELDLPMRVNSCCRSPEHNEKVGGHPSSLHLTENDKWMTGGSMAVDISTEYFASWEIDNLREFALSFGWSVGIAETFIHLDKRIQVGLPQRVWTY